MSAGNWAAGQVEELKMRVDKLEARLAKLGTPASAAEPSASELRSALDDLLSWFPDKPSDPEWRLKGGRHGADDAVAHARSLIGIANDA